MVTILVMYREQIQACSIKLTAALGANCTMDPERFRAVVLIAVSLTTHLFDKCRRLFGGREDYSSRASLFHRLIPLLPPLFSEKNHIRAVTGRFPLDLIEIYVNMTYQIVLKIIFNSWGIP